MPTPTSNITNDTTMDHITKIMPQRVLRIPVARCSSDEIQVAYRTCDLISARVYSKTCIHLLKPLSKEEKFY